MAIRLLRRLDETAMCTEAATRAINAKTRLNMFRALSELFQQSAIPVLSSITPLTVPYSVRRAFIGSTVAARRAGNSADNIATTATIKVPRINTAGSAGLTL